MEEIKNTNETPDTKEEAKNEIKVVKESKLKNAGSKAMKVVKKHGKKAATVAALGAAGLIGYLLGGGGKETILYVTDSDEDSGTSDVIDVDVTIED